MDKKHIASLWYFLAAFLIWRFALEKMGGAGGLGGLMAIGGEDTAPLIDADASRLLIEAHVKVSAAPHGKAKPPRTTRAPIAGERGGRAG